MFLRSFDPENVADQQTLLELALVQEARLSACMASQIVPRTPEALARQFRKAEHLVVVEDDSGKVRGAVQPAIWEIKCESVLRAFLGGRNGIAQHLILPASLESDASAVLKHLLQALETFWAQRNTDADLWRWSAEETWFVPLITNHGFQLDSLCAIRSLDPFFVTPPVAPAGLAFRLAQPADAPSLLRLFQQELLFHERYTPFVRSSSAVLDAFQKKLERVWAGESFEDGAPLIVVAEQEEALIAMVESTLVVVDRDEEPGFTPPGTYWCIDNVSVLEPFHGKGIGRVLLHTIESMRRMLQLDLAGYVLWYNPDNTIARQFWIKRGFRAVWATYQRR